MKRKIFRRLLAGFFILMALWLVFAQCTMKFRMSDTEAKKKFSEKGVELTTGYIKIDEFKMHYAKTGNDTLPTLFFIHGSPGGWKSFERYMRDSALLSKFRMISVDRPGFGYSEFGNAKNLDEQSGLISPFIRSFQNGKPMYAVGHSLGGALIVKLQIDNNELFSGLVLLAASVDPDAEKPEKWRPVIYKSPLKFFLPGAWRPSNEELWYLKKDLIELDTQWEKITCPIWIVHGDKDANVPISNVDHAKKKLTKAKTVEVTILPAAKHYIPWEQYNDVRSVLMKLPI